MELLVGLIGALVGIGLFVFGFFLGKAQPKEWTPKEEILTPEEQARIQEERAELIREQNAFRKLINYSADQAYGIEKPK